MDVALQLYGGLILTVVGFIVPILTILISLFPEGVQSLATKYENEKRQSDDNITSETQKRLAGGSLDYEALEKRLKTLKKNKDDAEFKLGFLKPTKFLFRTALPFMMSFGAVLAAALLEGSFYGRVIQLSVSLLCFVIGINTLVSSVNVLFEVAEVVNKNRNDNENMMVQLLSILVEKSGLENLYIKEGQIRVKFDGNVVKDGDSFDFSVDKKHEIKIAINNNSDMMAKKVQVGFSFPDGVIIEKSPGISITTTESKQIIRFNRESIHTYTSSLMDNLGFTFLESGKVDIPVFIKGENVKDSAFHLIFNIVK